MSKNVLNLRSAISNLNIQKPFQIKDPTEKLKCIQNEYTQIERTQNDSTESHIDKEVDHKKVEPDFKDVSGFFMLSNNVFSSPILRTLSGDTFRVFLWFSFQAYRFKNSDGITRASFRFISRNAGVSESSVSRCLDSLLQKKLIRREEINHKTGNRWWVSPILYGMKKESECIQNECTDFEYIQIECTQNEYVVHPKRTRSASNLGAECIQNDSKINISLKNSKDSFLISDEEEKNKLPEKLKTYFQELKPARKLNSELQAFKEIKNDFTVEEIESAFQVLISEDPKLLKYHSPMSYLSVSMKQILERVQEMQVVHAERVEKQDLQVAREAKLRADEERLQDELDEMESAFFEAFKTEEERAQMISEYSKGTTAKLPALVKSMAITKWWSERNNMCFTK